MQEFHEWCAREGERIADEMRADALRGITGKSVYFVPAGRDAWARLVLAHVKPEGATDVIRWRISGGATSARVDAVPYASIPSQLRDACARMPVYPVTAEALARAAGWRRDSGGIFHPSRGKANGTGDAVEYAADWEAACAISGV
jgi:hypothetical protein